MAEEKNAKEAVKAKRLTLEQKFVELRKAIPRLQQKQYSDGVKYKFLKISDIYEYLTPAMNECGVNFDIVRETPTRHYENGDPKYYDSYQQQTRSGNRTVWVYEADLTLQWVNADDPNDRQEVTLHALGTNDGGCDKAKGSAWTYALKYYFFEKFGVDQGADDPDMADHSGEAPEAGRNTSAGQNARSGRSDAPRALSDAQLSRMYRKGEAAGYTRGEVDQWIAQRYKQQDPRNLTREQYDEACNILDNATKQNGGTDNA